jgi:hypothetical protein
MMTEKNVPLLLATMAMIKVFPEKHDQGSWVDPCNTTMCFAGHAGMIAGATFDKDIYAQEDEWILDPNGKHVGDDQARDRDFNRRKGYKYIEEFATEKLGLTPEESSYLFRHNRTREQLENAVYKLADGWSIDYDGEFFKPEKAKEES